MILTTPPEPPKAPIVTVWIHGTRPESFTPAALDSFVDPIKKVLFLCKQGMHKATDLDRQYYLYTLAKKLCAHNPDMFSWEDMYLFGWSGKLNETARKIASEKLKPALLDISHEYRKKYSCTPKFQLVGHSHGCNVILKLAELLDEDQTDIIVDKAILLACPVQRHTKKLITNKLFKRVYSIHSHTDTIQLLDPQGLHAIFGGDEPFRVKHLFTKFMFPIFSERHFDPHQKLIHANIRWKNKALWAKDYDPIDAVYLRPVKKILSYLDRIKPNRGLTHVEFTLIPFVTQLSHVIELLDDYFAQGTQPLYKEHIDITIEL